LSMPLPLLKWTIVMLRKKIKSLYFVLVVYIIVLVTLGEMAHPTRTSMPGKTTIDYHGYHSNAKEFEKHLEK
jgi:hypothetical protein